MIRKTIVFVVLTLSVAGFTTPAHAQFGSGIVYDPTNYGNAVLRYQQLQLQLQQLVQTYDQVKQQYDFFQQQAQILQNMKQRYTAQVQQLNPFSASNTYGNTNTWTNAVNTGSDVSTAYGQLTTPLPQLDLTTVNPTTANDYKKQFGQLEVTDAINQESLQTIGDIRKNLTTNEQALKNLEDDSLSSDSSVNSQTQVLNKVNAAIILQLRQTQESNRLQLALLEQQTQESTAKREAQAQALATQKRLQELLQQPAPPPATLNKFRSPF